MLAAVIAHDLGAPLLKVPVPDVPAGRRRRSRPWPGWWPAWACPSSSSAARTAEDGRDRVLDEARDVMAGGAAGLAMGRAIFQEPDPAAMADQVAAIVHGR